MPQGKKETSADDLHDSTTPDESADEAPASSTRRHTKSVSAKQHPMLQTSTLHGFCQKAIAGLTHR